MDHDDPGKSSRQNPLIPFQVMQPEEAANIKFDPFDVTKIWPRCE